MTRSGLAPFDTLVDDVRPGATYLLTGGSGSGKTSCALLFASAGLDRGERVAMVGFGRRDAVLSHAEYLGIDLLTPLRDERLLLLRYRSDFARRIANALSAEPALDDLRRLLGEHRPKRVVIDSVSPLLDDGTPSALAPTGVVELLERLAAMALVTYPGDLRPRIDRRLEPLVQSAAAVLHLEREENGVHRLEVVTVRGPAVRATASRFILRSHDGFEQVAALPDENSWH
jgi:KaiC/GvpD/RAD55 family RecA-like ATPase